MDCISLRKFLAPEILCGVDARLQVASYTKNWGSTRILVVTDPHVEKSGWTQEVTQSLVSNDIDIVTFRDISPNPRDYEVMIGAELYTESGCDSIVAIGGGSVLDAAKGIAIVVSNGGNILNYEGVDMVTQPMPPLACIPTTGGTSADVSQFAIINDTTNRVKVAIISKSIIPDIALIDPKTLTTMDAYLTACTGVDAIVHAVEAFVSNASSPTTDLFATKALELLAQSLMKSIEDPDNLDYRGEVMFGSLYAGLAFSNASLGCNHALAHSIGGYLDLPHGECNALLLPHVVDFNFLQAEDRYLKIGELLGIDWAGMPLSRRRKHMVNYLIEMTGRLGIEGSLQKRGLTSRDVQILAHKAIKDPCNATNPVKPTVRDLEAVLEESL